MMSDAHLHAPRYSIATGVAWSVETRGLRLADGRGGVFELRYPDAAVFDLLSRGLDVAKVMDLTRWIVADTPAAAQARVSSLVDEWLRVGWIVPERA
jgi:hypothetical protein